MSCAEYKLLALDLDGTLLDPAGHVTAASREAILAAQAAGVEVVLATGRDYSGILWSELEGVPLRYVVTTNGSAVYRVTDRTCLSEHCLDSVRMAPVLQYLLQKGVYIEIFIDGRSYAPREVLTLADRLNMPDYIIRTIKANRTPIDDLVHKLETGTMRLQKVTLNFWQEPDGTYHSRDEVLACLRSVPDIVVVDGGFANLEFTASGVDKATGLEFLADHLGIPMAQTMAIGDSENDIAMLRKAGFGVAMGNAYPAVKQLAAAVTADNASDGVAAAIHSHLLKD